VLLHRAVEAELAVAVAVVLEDLDLVQRRAVADLERALGPRRRQARRDDEAQRAVAGDALQPEERLDDQAGHPTRRAGVPAPAAAYGVRRDAVDVGAHHVRLDLVARARLAAVAVAD